MIHAFIGALIGIATLVGGLWYTDTLPPQLSQNLGSYILQVPQGGTGIDGAPKYPIVGGGGTADFSASGSPWVVSLHATSTTASSTFQGVIAENVEVNNGFFQDSFGDCNGSTNKVVYTLVSGKLGCDTDQTGAGGGAFPFTPQADGNATSTTIIFKNGLISTASSTFTGNATTTGNHSVGSLRIGSDHLTDLVGTGLQVVGTTLTLDATGDWTGTIDGNNFAGGAIGAGDLLYGASAGSITELSIGATNTVLQSDGSIPLWTGAPAFQNLRALSTSATSSFQWWVVAPTFNATSTTATSTFANGIQLTAGCFRLPDGNCAGTGGGSGTINTGTTNRLGYYSGATTLDSANYLITDISNARLGIGTATPGTALGVTGQGVFTEQVTAANFYATSTTATNTFVGNFSAGTTTVNQLRVLNISTSTFTGGVQSPLFYSTGGIEADAYTSALLTANAGGVFEEYAGTSCTNQFVRSLSVLGVATCASVDLTADVTGDLPFANLAQVAANSVLGNNTAATADAASIATNTLFGAGVTPGFVLMSSNGTWVPSATAAGSGATFGQVFEIDTNVFSQASVKPTSTSLHVLEIDGTGTSTFWGGVSAFRSISAPYFVATSTTGISTSTFVGIKGTNIDLTSTTATSTAANGLDLSAGCFAIRGVCVGGIRSLGGLTVAEQTFVDDTNVTIASAGSTHTLGWSGQLAVSRGGTGLSAVGATNTVLVSDGTNNLYTGAPAFQNLRALSITATSSFQWWVTAPFFHATSTTATSTFDGGIFASGLSSNDGFTLSGGTLLLSGLTIDITSGANEHINIAPNGTGRVGISSSTPTTVFGVSGTTTTEGLVVQSTAPVATTTVSVGQLGNPGCIQIRDTNNSAWGRIYFTAGVLVSEAGTCQ